MKRIYKFTLAFVIALLLASTGTRAQDQPPATIHFRAMSWEDVIADLQYVNGKAMVPVSILPNGRSQFYDYTGPDPLIFYRQVTGPDGKPLYKEEGTVPPDQFLEHMLLLFFRTPNVEGHYSIMTMDDSESSLPGGSYRFMNFTGTPLAVTCGSATGTVAAQDSLLLAGLPPDGGQTTGVLITANIQGAARPVYSNRWPFSRATRTLVLVFQNPKSKAYELKRIPEDVAVLPKPKPPK